MLDIVRKMRLIKLSGKLDIQVDINVAEIIKYLNANNYKTSIGGNFNKNSLN